MQEDIATFTGAVEGRATTGGPAPMTARGTTRHCTPRGRGCTGWPSAAVNQQNRLHPYYLAHINDDGEIVADHTEVKRLLDLIRTSCKGRAESIRDLCAAFNERTQDGRSMDRYSELLSAAIRSMIEVKEEKDLDSLFSGGRTTALMNAIAVLGDFELIAFPVVEGGR